MGRRGASGRKVDGILLLDKPSGITSNGALQAVKKLYKARKAGHTGSLDPLASGMLPICFGEATKFSQFLLDDDKTYLVTGKLGIETTTADAEGDVVETREVKKYSQKVLNKIIEQFSGEIEQIPSMFSAIKHQGQPLYKLARQGIEVERKKRQVTIYELDLLHYDMETIDLRIHCSKGTYVRNLIEDIGRALGCGAHVSALRRVSVGPYLQEQMVTVPELKQLAEENLSELDQKLLLVESALMKSPPIILNSSMSYYIQQGQPVWLPKAPTEGLVRLYTEDGELLGVGEILEDGRIAPKRLKEQVRKPHKST